MGAFVREKTPGFFGCEIDIRSAIGAISAKYANIRISNCKIGLGVMDYRGFRLPYCAAIRQSLNELGLDLGGIVFHSNPLGQPLEKQSVEVF